MAYYTTKITNALCIKTKRTQSNFYRNNNNSPLHNTPLNSPPSSNQIATEQWQGECKTFNVGKQQYSSQYWLDAPDTNANEIVFTMTHATGDGFDPDLFVRWSNEASRSDNDFHNYQSTSPVELAVPPTASQRGNARLYFTIFAASGEGSVQLCLAKYECRNKNCGGPNRGTCTPSTGTCACKADQFAGDFCNIALVSAEFGKQLTTTIRPGQSTAFKFTATENPPNGSIHFYMKKTSFEPITARAKRNLLPTRDDYDVELDSYSYQYESELLINQHTYASGTWYILVETPALAAAPFDVTVKGDFFACPNDCSGNGVCDHTTSVCACNAGYEMMEDCSVFAKELKPGQDTKLALPSHQHTSIHFVIDKQTVNNNVEIAVEFQTEEQCTDDCPRIYIARGNTANREASPQRFIASSPIPPPRVHAVSIPDFDLHEGTYSGSIYNPGMNTMNGRIRVVSIPHCPNDCSTGGLCLPTGVCQCFKGHFGSDCGVTKDTCKQQFNNHSEGFTAGWTFIFIIVGVVLGAVLGIFIFKNYANKRAANPQARVTEQEQNVYEQLN